MNPAHPFGRQRKNRGACRGGFQTRPYLAEKHDAILRAGGDEICAGLRIIVAWQTQGAAAWARVVGHGCWP